MIGLAVIVGEVMVTNARPDIVRLAEGFLTGFFICGYSMVVNDMYDVEIDTINQPRRPIPSGLVSIKGARFLAVTLLFLGICFSAVTENIYAVLISIIYSILSLLYNSRLKKKGLAGNAIVSSSLAIPFIYGGFLYGVRNVSTLLIIMALTSFTAGLGREVVKGIADIRGDREKGVNSFAVVHGARNASRLASTLFIVSVALSLLPVLMGNANIFYTVGIVVPDSIFVYLAIATLRKLDELSAIRIKNIALLGMLSGLIVFIGGAV